MSGTIRVAAVALATVDGMMRENYARALRMGEIALDAAPDVILFPEAFAAGYCGTDLRPYAETFENDTARAFRELSRRGKCILVYGFLEKVSGGVRNSVAVYDRGELLGLHSKRSLWPDKDRPERDEVSLMMPGKALEVFPSRFGPFAVLICYECMIAANWDEVNPQVAFVLTPYNCEGDPAHNNLREAKRLGIPSAWADRTGTVYAGGGYVPNPGTAGLVDGNCHEIAHSAPGVEVIVVGELPLR